MTSHPLISSSPHLLVVFFLLFLCSLLFHLHPHLVSSSILLLSHDGDFIPDVDALDLRQCWDVDRRYTYLPRRKIPTEEAKLDLMAEGSYIQETQPDHIRDASSELNMDALPSDIVSSVDQSDLSFQCLVCDDFSASSFTPRYATKSHQKILRHVAVIHRLGAQKKRAMSTENLTRPIAKWQ